MSHRRKRVSATTFALMFVLILEVPRTCAQILEEREYRGEKIMCIQSGLRGFAMPCGTDGNYAYVFVGSVLSVAEISDTEKRLKIVPEELFLGDAESPLTVTTSQGACLPEIHAGDRWLFYLRRERDSDDLFLSYGGPSEPLAEAHDDIKMLRQLVQLTDSGVVKGNVTRRYAWDGYGAMFPVINHTIVAKRKSDGSEYRTTTNRDGQFQFERLPSGSYDLSANTDEGIWAESGSVRVHDRSCSNVDFEMRSAGRISGHIRAADGKPFQKHPWVQVHSISGSDDNLASGYVDEGGYYEVNGLEPGRYLVGIRIVDGTGDPAWWPRVYYPGAPTREQAVIVELGPAEKRSDINFQLQKESAP